MEARLFCTTALAQPVLLWSFLALPILLMVHFGADLFVANFTKIYFSFAFFSIFLNYKKFFSVFFQKQSKIFVYFNKFLCTQQKKIQVQTHRYCFFFFFGYSSNNR